MEVGTRIVKSVHGGVSTSNSSSSASGRPVMSPSRLAKLPPISSSSGGERGEGEEEVGSQGHHPSSLFLKTATTELKETMQHLLCEVRI